MKNIEGKYALVTGASSGIGWDIAKILGEKGCNLIIVARREDKLKELQKLITTNNKVDIKTISMDLSVQESPRALYEKVKQFGINIDILVNNAGYAIHDMFLNIPWENEKSMLNLLILNLVHLTKLFAKDMVKRDFGYILQISSVGAFHPVPNYTTYSAAKSFVLNFGNSLNYELKKTNVSCSVLCPGVTETEFQKVVGEQKETLFQRLTKMPSRRVAQIGIKNMLKGRFYTGAGVVNSFNAKIMSLLPRRISAAISYWATGVIT
ncbi:MAG: SDR family oxidoreductase [Spirochaetota bacterium]|nr:MAG: SDR family oxidoreductase [Spirochaetota bacterium]